MGSVDNGGSRRREVCRGSEVDCRSVSAKEHEGDDDDDDDDEDADDGCAD